MKHRLIYQAIKSLRSGANFSIDDQDSSKVVFADGKTTVPSDEDLQTEINRLEARQVIMDKIIAFEAQVTPRRVRDSGSDDAGGTQAGRDWMKSKEAAIATERAKL